MAAVAAADLDRAGLPLGRVRHRSAGLVGRAGVVGQKKGLASLNPVGPKAI